MPVPSNVGDLSPNPATNSPTGNETVGPNLDDYLRSGFAFTRQIATDFSGDSQPANPFPYMTWADTSSNMLKRRNSAGTGWVTLGPLYSPGRFYEQGSEPTENIGDILVNGIGPCRWNATDSRYYSIPGTRGLRLRFNSSQSWTPDAYSKTAARVVVQGGGGGGGYGGSGASIGGGGGGGGAPGVTIERTDVTLTPGVAMTVTVGAGGVGATASTPSPAGGGASSFAGLSAPGGALGGLGDGVFGGVARGNGATAGGNGAASASGPSGNGGVGGGTILGHGGLAGWRSGTSGEAGTTGGDAPTANSGAGGGGAGGSLATTSFRFGGNGAAGCVIVEL